MSTNRKRSAFVLALVSLAAAALFLAACTTAGGGMTKDAKGRTESPAMGGDKTMAGPTAMMPVKYAGYLMDSACGVPGKGMDGADVVRSPQDHTQHCLVDCAASGYGISVKDGMVYKYIPFDKAGSDVVLSTILQKTTKTKGVSIEVEGTLSGGVLTVRSIKETAGMM